MWLFTFNGIWNFLEVPLTFGSTNTGLWTIILLNSNNHHHYEHLAQEAVIKADQNSVTKVGVWGGCVGVLFCLHRSAQDHLHSLDCQCLFKSSCVLKLTLQKCLYPHTCLAADSPRWLYLLWEGCQASDTFRFFGPIKYFLASEHYLNVM